MTDSIIKASTYILPRLITSSISTIFTIYFRDLFVHTLKWDPGDFNTVNLIYTITLGIAYFVIGLIIHFSVESTSTDGKTRLGKTRWIEISAVVIHSLSFYLIVCLPTIWSSTGRSPVYGKVEPSTSAIKGKLDEPISKEILATSSSYSDPPPEYESIFGVARPKKFTVYSLTVAHAIGLSLFYLSNRSISTYIYPNNSKSKELRTMDGIDICLYGFGILLINLIISISKFFLLRIISESTLFVIIAGFLLISQFSILYLFNGSIDKFTPEVSQETLSMTFSDYLELFCIIIFHTSANFWFVTLGPLIQYISTYALDGNAYLKTFGPFVALTGFAIGAVFNILWNQSSTIGSEDSSGHTIIGACILGQTLIYFLFIPFNYSWNIKNWFNLLILAICGGVYGLFLININVMLDKLLKTTNFKDYKWLVIGGFLGFTRLFLSLALYILYKFYSEERLITYNYSCILWSVVFNFPRVYKGITLLFQILNIIACIAYFISDSNKIPQILALASKAEAARQKAISLCKQVSPIENNDGRGIDRLYQTFSPEQQQFIDAMMKTYNLTQKGAMEQFFACEQEEELAKQYLEAKYLKKFPITSLLEVKGVTATPPETESPNVSEHHPKHARPTSSPDDGSRSIDKVMKKELTSVQQQIVTFIKEEFIPKYTLKLFVDFNTGLGSDSKPKYEWDIGNELEFAFDTKKNSLKFDYKDFEFSAIHVAKEAVPDFNKYINPVAQDSNQNLDEFSNGLKKLLLLHQSQLGQIRDTFAALNSKSGALIDGVASIAQKLNKESSEKPNQKLDEEDIEHCKKFLNKLFNKSKRQLTEDEIKQLCQGKQSEGRHDIGEVSTLTDEGSQLFKKLTSEVDPNSLAKAILNCGQDDKLAQGDLERAKDVELQGLGDTLEGSVRSQAISSNEVEPSVPEHAGKTRDAKLQTRRDSLEAFIEQTIEDDSLNNFIKFNRGFNIRSSFLYNWNNFGPLGSKFQQNLKNSNLSEQDFQASTTRIAVQSISHFTTFLQSEEASEDPSELLTGLKKLLLVHESQLKNFKDEFSELKENLEKIEKGVDDLIEELNNELEEEPDEEPNQKLTEQDNQYCKQFLKKLFNQLEEDEESDLTLKKSISLTNDVDEFIKTGIPPGNNELRQELTEFLKDVVSKNSLPDFAKFNCVLDGDCKSKLKNQGYVSPVKKKIDAKFPDSSISDDDYNYASFEIAKTSVSDFQKYIQESGPDSNPSENELKLGLKKLLLLRSSLVKQIGTMFDVIGSDDFVKIMYKPIVKNCLKRFLDLVKTDHWLTSLYHIAVLNTKHAINNLYINFIKKLILYIKCNKICTKLRDATTSIQGCIKEAANDICTKLGQLHTCFPAQLRSACTNICTNLGDTQLQEALQRTCKLVSGSFKAICEAIVKYINRICGKECQCCKQAGATHDCTTHTCTCPAKCICIKCAICKAASGICTAINQKATGWQQNVNAACTAICRWLDKVHNAVTSILEEALDPNKDVSTCDVFCVLLTFIFSGLKCSCLPKNLEDIKTSILNAIKKLCNCPSDCKCKCCKQLTTATCTCGKDKNCLCLKCRVCTDSDGISTGIKEACEGLTDGIQGACREVCQRVDNIRDKWTAAFSGAATTDCNITAFSPSIDTNSISCSSGCTVKTNDCAGTCNNQDTECTDCDTEINGASGCEDNIQKDTKTTTDTIKNQITNLLAGYAESAVESVCVYAKAAAQDLEAACTKANDIQEKLTGLTKFDDFNNLGHGFYNKAQGILDTNDSPKETRAQQELNLIKYMQIGANINLNLI